jgi:hypothetical protein
MRPQLRREERAGGLASLVRNADFFFVSILLNPRTKPYVGHYETPNNVEEWTGGVKGKGESAHHL